MLQATTDERRTADAIVQALAEAGVEHVLGMPGGATIPIWSALHDHPTVRAVQVRAEGLGSYVAESYGRLRGTPIVVMGQGEWIVGNAGQGLLEAHLGSSPVVVLTEMSDGAQHSHHAPYQSGAGHYGTWDAKSALAAVTKRVMVSHHPVQSVQLTQLALKHAVTGTPGPVAVLFSNEALRGSVGERSRPRLYPTGSYLAVPRPAVDQRVIGEVVRRLGEASSPVVVAGNGVRVGQACRSLELVAEELDLPVITSAGGKGVFPEQDARAGGPMGPFGSPAANRLLEKADFVLAVGTRLSSSDTAEGHPALIDPSRQVIVQIDIEPLNAAWTTPTDHVLLGDAGQVMDALRLEARGGPKPWPPAAGRVRAAQRPDAGAPADREPPSPGAPLHPRAIIETLREAVPEETIVTCDAGENRLFMMQWFRAAGGGGYLQPAAGGGMGYAVPAAMGAKLAFPERPVLAVCGDGGFSMSLHGVLTAIEQNLPICVAVLNNDALGWVLHGARHPVAARLAHFDFAAIATAMGAEGAAVSSLEELHDAVGGIGSLSRPLIVDIPTSLEVSFKDVLQDPGAARRESGY